MEQVTLANARRKGTRQKKLVLKIDMTPMVDLGFLLISFFVITTQLSQPKVMDLIVPTEGRVSELENSKALTVILRENGIAFFEGKWTTALSENRIKVIESPFQLRNVIKAKQEFLDRSSKTEGRNGLMIIIKPSKGADYKTLVDVFDEILISDVRKYALTNLTGEEIEWVEKKMQNN